MAHSVVLPWLMLVPTAFAQSNPPRMNNAIGKYQECERMRKVMRTMSQKARPILHAFFANTPKSSDETIVAEEVIEPLH